MVRGPSPARVSLPLAGKVGPAFLVAALITPTLIWISLDRSVWPWDPSLYGRESIELWTTLRLDPGAWPAAMEQALGAKPPGVVWLGQFFVPLAEVLGSLQPALLLTIVACQAVVLVLVYAVVRRLVDEDVVAALAAILFTAGAPLFVSMSREYFAEPLQTLAVAWVLFIMISAARWHPASTVVQLVAAVSLGLLAKVSSPLYMVAPAAVALRFAAKSGPGWSNRGVRRNPESLLVLGLAGGLLLGTVAWYATNFDRALDHARFAAESELYGTDEGFLAELVARLGRLEDAALLPHFSLALLPLAAWATATAIRRRRGLRAADLTSHRALCYAACLGTVGAVLAALALQTNEEVRFLLPLIPCLAVLLGGTLSMIGSGRVAALAVAVLACHFTLVNLQGFGSFVPDELTYFRIRSPAHPAFAHELRRIARLTCTEQADGRVSVVGVDYSWLNTDTLSMLAEEQFALAGRRCRYTSLGSAEGDPDEAWARVRRLEPAYYIGIDYGNAANPLPQALAGQIALGDPFNRVNAAVFERVLRSGRFTAIPAARRSGIVVLRSCYEPIRPFVEAFHRRALRRPPRRAELSGWVSRLTRALRHGQGQLLLAARSLGATVFGSAEYAGLKTRDSEFVTDLYAAYLGRAPDRTGYDGWLRALRNGRSRSGVRDAFAFGEEFRDVVRRLCVPPPKRERS